MRRVTAALLGVALVIAGRPVAAVPYSIAGPWAGSARERGKSPVTLTAAFTAASPRKFSGTVVASDGGDPPSTCTVSGKSPRPGVAIHGSCDDGGTIAFHGRLSVRKQTIGGTYVEKRNGQRHHGTFTLANAGGPVLTGGVSAPAGSLASLQHRSFLDWMLARLVAVADAQSAGLAPVPNANVLVFTIGNDGKPTSTSPIATTTTGPDGRYSLALPAGTTLGSNLLLQASSSTTPAPVGSPGRQSCPATQAVLDVSPVSEYATRALIAAVASNASALANFTPAEINAIIAKVNALASDPTLVGATIEETIANITNAIDPAVRDDLRNAATPGEATLPQGLGGIYNFVQFGADDTGPSQTLAQQSGTLTVDLSARTFAYTGPKASVVLSEICAATQNAPCNRTFTRSASSGIRSGNGTVTLLGGNQLLFQPSSGEHGALGFYDATGDVLVLTSGDGLIVAFKQTAGAPAAGGAYRAVELDGGLTDSFTAVQGVPFGLGSATTQVNDPTTIAGGAVSGTSSKTTLSKAITCNGGQSCSYTETISASTGGASFTAPVSIDATGALTVSPVGEVPHLGAVGAGGDLFAFVDGDPVGNGDGGLVIGVKQPGGMSEASLSGAYGLVEYDVGVGPGSRTVQSQSGIVRLDGHGGIQGNLASSKTRIDTSCGGGFCPGVTSSQRTKTESPNTTYAVTATGAVTIAGSDGPIPGFASADGSVLVFTQQHDASGSPNDTDSQRGMMILLK